MSDFNLVITDMSPLEVWLERLIVALRHSGVTGLTGFNVYQMEDKSTDSTFYHFRFYFETKQRHISVGIPNEYAKHAPNVKSEIAYRAVRGLMTDIEVNP